MKIEQYERGNYGIVVRGTYTIIRQLLLIIHYYYYELL